MKEVLPYLHKQVRTATVWHCDCMAGLGSEASRRMVSREKERPGERRVFTIGLWWQALVQQQQGRAQRAFLDYQEAHDAHASAKAAAAALEAKMMGTAGKADSDTDLALLSQYSDAASHVVETENMKMRADKQHGLEARLVITPKRRALSVHAAWTGHAARLDGRR